MLAYAMLSVLSTLCVPPAPPAVPRRRLEVPPHHLPLRLPHHTLPPRQLSSAGGLTSPSPHAPASRRQSSAAAAGWAGTGSLDSLSRLAPLELRRSPRQTPRRPAANAARWPPPAGRAPMLILIDTLGPALGRSLLLSSGLQEALLGWPLRYQSLRASRNEHRKLRCRVPFTRAPRPCALPPRAAAGALGGPGGAGAELKCTPCPPPMPNCSES